LSEAKETVEKKTRRKTEQAKSRKWEIEDSEIVGEELAPAPLPPRSPSRGWGGGWGSPPSAWGRAGLAAVAQARLAPHIRYVSAPKLAKT
jgi:hypothetical protein